MISTQGHNEGAEPTMDRAANSEEAIHGPSAVLCALSTESPVFLKCMAQ
jgi:hypothetical protein